MNNSILKVDSDGMVADTIQIAVKGVPRPDREANLS